MERVRIAVLDAYDNVLAFMDNGAPKALHYYEDELHEYLKGTANTLTFCAGAKHEDAQYLVEGNKLSFLYRGKEYYLNIMSVRRDELEVEVTAYSLSFELLNEEKEKYAATEAKTFAQYLEIFDAEHIITLGNNEVSDKSVKHEWEGADTMLARIFSLATVFDAEVEFIPQLNDNYSLKEIRMNVYKEHTDEIQGIGVNRNDIVLRYGKNVTGIVKTSDITGLYTAIRPFGRDGLTITDLDKAEYDADGNLEYSSPAGNNNILAPQARDRFPSNLWSANDRYIAKIYEYDTDNVNVLYGNALSELKKNCVPKVEYEVSGYFDTDIGDTVQIEDDEYNPALYLEARVTEQVRSFTDLTRNKTTFDNFHELQSQLDSDLVAKMNALIEQNKTYTCMISTDNGTTFKNNTGSTTLTASVRDGVTDVTDKFEIAWSKDGADLANGKSITVNAADVDGKALYRFDAKDSNGNEKGFYEVTVTDVSDGTDGVSPTVEVNEDTSLTITDSEGTKNTGPLKGADGISSYTHIKYSDDGETFTGKGNLASRKREDWVKGHYSSSTTIDTEAPDELTASNNYNRICMKKAIPVVPGEKYQITSGHPFIGMGITKYGADGNSVGIDTVDGSLSIQQYKVPDDTYHVRLYMSGSSPYVTKYGSWNELFEKNSVSPMFGEPESKLGSYPGAWMGQMVSDDPTPSTTFEDYTWKKIEGEPGKDGEPTGIVESDDEPTDKYVGMLWKNTGTTSGLVQGATYRWNGTEWEMYKFSAVNIEAETFKGYEFYGSIFESEFIEKLDALHRTEGKVTIKDGRITVVANSQTNDLGSENGWNTVSTDKMTIDGYGLEIESDTHMRQLRIQHLLAVAKLLDVRETEEGGDQRNGYRKYASGRMEQWITVEKTLDVTNAWGGCYISAKQAAQEYPVPFLSVPSVQITVTGNGTDGAWIMMLDEGSATQTPKYHLVRGAKLDEAKDFKILIRAWGECEKEEEII